MKKLHTRMLFDQGSAKIAEDGLIFQPPHHFGVTDGLSGVYLPQKGPDLFGRRTGGQLVSSILTAAFSAFEMCDLEDAMEDANTLLAETLQHAGLPMSDSAFLPGASFVVCSVDEEWVELIQGGDCSAVWQASDGSCCATRNRNYEYEKKLLDIIAKLMEKHGGNRAAMWEEFRPILIRERRDWINTPGGRLCLANGQQHFVNYWQRETLKRDDLDTLILFSDGFVPFEMTREPERLVAYVMEHYKSGGLQGVLAATRSLAAEKVAKSHEDFAEATAIAIEF